MENKVTLGYWGIRGLGEVLRQLLAVTGTAFEDKCYTSREAWFDEDKKNLGFEFPGLPYLIDGDFKLSETKAIQQYIIEKSNRKELLGKCINERTQVFRLLGVIEETFKDIKGLLWNKEYETAKNAKLQAAEPKLKMLDKYLGNKDFFLGYLTLADFYAAEVSFIFETLFPQAFKQYGFMCKIRCNLYSLPEIKEYYKKEGAIKPFVPPTMAAFQVKWSAEVHEHPKGAITLGYWNIRGLGQTPRLLLSYAGVDFEENVYNFEQGGKQKWFEDDKINLGLEFPDLPYLITPEVKLTQTKAVQRYIGEKWAPELLGKNVKDAAIVNEVVGVLSDVRAKLLPLFFNPDFENLKAKVFEQSQPKFESISKFVGDKSTVLGYVTVVDFIISETASFVEKLSPQSLKEYLFLSNIRKTINELPSTVKYYARPTAIKEPYLIPSKVVVKI